LQASSDGSGVKRQVHSLEFSGLTKLEPLPGLFSKGKKRELREQREAPSPKLQATSPTHGRG